MRSRTLALIALMMAGAFVAWEVARPAGPRRIGTEEYREDLEEQSAREFSPLVEIVDPEEEDAERERAGARDRDRIEYPQSTAAGPPVQGEDAPDPSSEDPVTDELDEFFEDLADSLGETSWIRGRLLAESGGFELSALALDKGIVVELSSREPPVLSMQADLKFVVEADGTRSIGFAFEEVPLGRYELSVSSLGNQRWAPARLEVSPPEEGLEFLRYDLDASGEVLFRVTNAETSEPVPDYRLRTVRATHSEENGVFLHTGPLDPADVPMQGAVAWTVDAPGFAPAFGDETDFYLEAGRRICEVRLLPGWATRFLVLGRAARSSDGEPVTVALQGAEIALDGVVIGRTGADGTLVCRRREKPSEIEVRHGDMVVRGDPDGVVEGRGASQRGNISVVLMSSSD